jgi:hypothetical protein
MLAEVIDPLPQGAIADFKFIGDFLLGTAIDKNGTQRLVTTMIRMVGLTKEVLATAVIHDPGSMKVLTICETNRGKWYGQITHMARQTTGKPWKLPHRLENDDQSAPTDSTQSRKKRVTLDQARCRKNQPRLRSNVTHFPVRKSGMKHAKLS